MELALIIAVVVVALVFDYTNGFHDAANAIATSVSTRALTPRVALAIAAIMNLIGAFLGQEVAETVSETIAAPDGSQGLVVVLGGLVGAIAWNLITWYFGLPSSSSHALIGGLVGAGLASASTVHWDTIVSKVLIPMVVSPVVGFGVAFLLMIVISWIFYKRNPARTNRGFRIAQTFSASAMALGHGLQDAQKTMGVIVLALVTGGYLEDNGEIPPWVVFAAAGAISPGHLRRRLAHHADARPPSHRARPGARFCLRVDCCWRALYRRHRFRCTHLDDAHDHLSDHGRRRHQTVVGGPLGGRRQHRHRVDPDLPDGSGHGRGRVLAAARGDWLGAARSR